MRRSELTTWKGILGPNFKEDSQYADFEGDDMVWVIPAARTKKTREHIVAIPQTARELIEDVQGDFNLLFTNDTKRPEKEKRPLPGFSRVKGRIDVECGFDDWVLHDLRRTLRSGLARLGFPSEVGKKVINHKLTGMDAVYDQYEYLPQRRRALMSWADYVESLLTESDKTNVADLLAHHPEAYDAPSQGPNYLRVWRAYSRRRLWHHAISGARASGWLNLLARVQYKRHIGFQASPHQSF